MVGGGWGRGLGASLPRRLGDSDCEAVHSGLLAQPVNTLSSLAFLVVGGALVVYGLRRPAGQRWLPAVYGAAIAANFAGGVLFHGPAWPGSAWIHDVAIIAPLLFIVLYDVSTMRPMTTVQLLGTGAVVLAIVGMVLAGSPQSSNAVSAVFAALALGTELASAGRRYAFRRARQAYAVAIGALVVGVSANLLGRTGGPLCSDGSPFQGHALWHLCTAVALGAWGVAAFAARRVPATARPTAATPAR